MQKSSALRAVTDFLEIHHRKDSGHVCIVTGTGSHSQNGPVLRSSVEELLNKRKMEYHRNSPGSFLVRVNTGIQFWHQASTQEDTKIIFRERSEGDSGQCLKPPAVKPYRTNQPRQPVSTIAVGPSPSEVAQNDADLEQARDGSLQNHRREMKNQQLEQNHLNVALRESLATNENDEEAEFVKSMTFAIEKSKMQATAEKAEEDKLQRAIQESIDNHKQRPSDQEFEQSLHEALCLSLESFNQKFDRQMGSSVDEDEDEELRKALALSLELGDPHDSYS